MNVVISSMLITPIDSRVAIKRNLSFLMSSNPSLNYFAVIVLNTVSTF